MRPISSGRMLFVPSKSRLELEVEKAGGMDEARQRFKSAEVWHMINESHHAQKVGIASVANRGMIVDRSRLFEVMCDYDLIVSLGGDNHFTYIGQAVLEYARRSGEEKYIIGCVLDPKKSLGALCSTTVQALPRTLERIGKGDYLIDEWTALEAKVDGSDAYPAVGEYFIGELNRTMMSRTIATVDGHIVLPEKSSGILAVSGAGAGIGSWYNNVRCEKPIQKTENIAIAITTEDGRGAKYVLYHGQTLRLVSNNDDHGVIVPDSHNQHEFRMGSIAEVRIAEKGLLVVR
jgi:hypothetical protein